MNARFSKRYRIAVLVAAWMVAIVSPAPLNAQNSQPIPAALQKQILANPGIAILGSDKADVTIVEYLDYNCPFCKKLAPDFQTLVITDHGVAVIYKEWPIFGGVSVYAARSALAAQWQGKYLQAHNALISGPHLAQNEQVDAALQRSGIDMAQLKKDLVSHGPIIDSLLSRNHTEALELQLRGTPGVLIGGNVIPNASDLKDLQTAVAYVRHAH